MSNKHLMSNLGSGAKPVETHWYRVCVCDGCSHDTCVNPLDNLWSLHLSCHSAKCHMSFSFAFPSQWNFSPPSTHCYTCIYFRSFCSLYCFIVLLCHSEHSHSMHFSFFASRFYFCLSYTLFHFRVFQWLSCRLALKDHLCPSGYFWQWNVPGFRFLWC